MSQFGVSSILLQTTAPPFLCANSAFGNVMWVLGAYGIKAFFLKKCNQVENIWMDFVDEDKKPKFSTFRAGFLMCLPRILLNDL